MLVKTFEFSREGFEKAKSTPSKKIKNIFDEYKKKTIGGTLLIEVLQSNTALAKTTVSDNAMWKFVNVSREGLFWICMFTSIYGLYLMVLKKDDIGKKIIVRSILVYIASWIIPDVFLGIRETFSAK